MMLHRLHTRSWLEDVPRRYRSVAQAKALFPGLRERRVQRRHAVTYVFTVTVPVPNYEPRGLRIEFHQGRHGSPKVFVDGPTDSPHRYRHEDDRCLCLWYPRDGHDRRWEPKEGLDRLIGMIVTHLFKEEYWRETGEWLGDEGPHGEQVHGDGGSGRHAA